MRAALGGLLAAHVAVGLASLLGFAGAMLRRAVLVRTYAIVLHINWCVGLAIAVGFGLRALRAHPDQRVARCVNRQLSELEHKSVEDGDDGTAPSSDLLHQLIHKECLGAFRLFITLFLGCIAVYHIVGLYFLVVAHRAAAEMRHLEEQKRREDAEDNDNYLDEEAKSPQAKHIESVIPPPMRETSPSSLPAITRYEGAPVAPAITRHDAAPVAYQQPQPYQYGRSLAGGASVVGGSTSSGEAGGGGRGEPDWASVGLNSATSPKKTFKYPWRQ